MANILPIRMLITCYLLLVVLHQLILHARNLTEDRIAILGYVIKKLYNGLTFKRIYLNSQLTFLTICNKFKTYEKQV